MKKIAIILVALAPAIAPAKPIDAMPQSQVDETDLANWYTDGSVSFSYTDETWEYYNKFVNKLESVAGALRRCVDESSLTIPDRERNLEVLLEELSVLLATSVCIEKDKHLEKGNQRVLALLKMARSINNVSRQAPKLLVESIIARRVVKHRYEWTMAAEVIVNFKMVSRLQKIDECYGNFLNGIETIINKKRQYSMSGSTLLMKVGFNDYVKKDLTLRPELEADLRVLDRYLALMEKSKLNDFKESIKKVKEESSNALWMLNKEHDQYEELAIEIYKRDRPMFEAFFKNWVLFLDKVDECVKDCEELIADADNTSKDVGKLRHQTGFHPNRSMICLGKYENNAPQYWLIVRALVKGLKEPFLKNAEKRRNKYTEHVPTTWD